MWQVRTNILFLVTFLFDSVLAILFAVLSLDQCDSEEVVRVIAAKNFAAVQTASGKVS